MELNRELNRVKSFVFVPSTLAKPKIIPYNLGPRTKDQGPRTKDQGPRTKSNLFKRKRSSFLYSFRFFRSLSNDKIFPIYRQQNQNTVEGDLSVPTTC
jgi:hypothetical protein